MHALHLLESHISIILRYISYINDFKQLWKRYSRPLTLTILWNEYNYQFFLSVLGVRLLPEHARGAQDLEKHITSGVNRETAQIKVKNRHKENCNWDIKRTKHGPPHHQETYDDNFSENLLKVKKYMNSSG